MSKCECKAFPHDDWCPDHPHQCMRREIEALEAKVVKLERVKDAAHDLINGKPRYASNISAWRQAFDAALAACDDGIGYFSHQRGRTEASDDGEGA